MALTGLLSWSCSANKNIAGNNGMGEINATFEADYGVRASLAAEDDNATIDDIEAISPKELRDNIKERIERTRNLYK